MDRVPMLVATEGSLDGERFPVSPAGLLIGRDEACDVVIDDPGISRHHARVLLHNASVWVQDAGSRNGVYVNERRITRHTELGPGDQLRVGSHRFLLELVPAFPDEHSSSISRIQEVATQRVRPLTVVIVVAATLIAAAAIAWMVI